MGQSPCSVSHRPCDIVCGRTVEIERSTGRGSVQKRDPRLMLADFFATGDERGPAGFLKCKGLSAGEKQTSWFAVFRPTSSDAISLMVDGLGTGKGLNIKGKSAKKGKLSGFVPVLQISNNNHKRSVCTSPKGARVKIYFRSSQLRDTAVSELRDIMDEMLREVSAANKRLKAHKDGTAKLDDDAEMQAYESLVLDVENPSVDALHSDESQFFGVELPERLLREAYITRKDIARAGEWQTGRDSEPAFMDMNLQTLRNDASRPRPVIMQVDEKDPMNPLSLVMAYEEQEVKAVVSDFDAFMIGSAGAVHYETLPESQVEMVQWCLRSIEEVLGTPSDQGWMSRWLAVLKREADTGWHPEIPPYGFGDPTSSSIVKEMVNAMRSYGAVRHGAECFNFHFPQDLDEEFLIIWDGFATPDPWQYMKEPELRNFLVGMIAKGFSFPLNPKWIACDRGWFDVLTALASSEQGIKNLPAWYPTGLLDKLMDINRRFPKGFQSVGNGERLDPEVAELQLRRYQILQRARKKLKMALKLSRGMAATVNAKPPDQEGAELEDIVHSDALKTAIARRSR